MQEQYAIFIEPPGNIQKELHALRLTSAKVTQDAQILSYPDIIPVYVSKEPLYHEKIFFYEELFRGHTYVQKTIVHDEGYLFLPVLIENKAAETIITQEQVPIAWKLGNIALGKENSLEAVRNALSSTGPFHFSSGRIILSRFSLLDTTGASFTMQIIASIHRKKL